METFTKKELLKIKKYYVDTIKKIEELKNNGSSKRKLELLEDSKNHYQRILNNSNIVFNESLKTYTIKKDLFPRIQIAGLAMMIVAGVTLASSTKSHSANVEKNVETYKTYGTHLDLDEINKASSVISMSSATIVGQAYQTNPTQNQIKYGVITQEDLTKQEESTQEEITVETKTYYDINAREELQDFIVEKAEEYGIPAEIAFTLIEKETHGNWASNGVISATNDYGLAQINICNHKAIYNALGYTSDDILNDEYKNIDAMFYLLQCIFNQYGYTNEEFSYENVFGTYNGWVNWKNISSSVNYANACMEILEELKTKTYEKEIENTHTLTLSK